MKTNLTKSLSVFIFLIILSGCGNYGSYGGYGDMGGYGGYGNANERFGVTAWTNSSSNIKVFINGSAIGVLTQAYETQPQCGAPGCIYYDTEDGGIKISIRAESTDGLVRWAEKSMRLNRKCRMVQFVQKEWGTTEILMN